MISDDIRGVARHLQLLADGRGRLRLGADTTETVLAWLTTVAEQVGTLEKNAVRLDEVPVRADDPARLQRELERMLKRARGLDADAAAWTSVALADGQWRRVESTVAELATALDDLVLRLRAHEAEAAADDEKDSRARASQGGEVVNLASARAARAPAAARHTGPDGSAA